MALGWETVGPSRLGENGDGETLLVVRESQVSTKQRCPSAFQEWTSGGKELSALRAYCGLSLSPLLFFHPLNMFSGRLLTVCSLFRFVPVSATKLLRVNVSDYLAPTLTCALLHAGTGKQAPPVNAGVATGQNQLGRVARAVPIS